MGLQEAEWTPLTELMEKYRATLVAQVSRKLAPRLAARFSADDIVEEAFYRACRKWRQTRVDSQSISYTWLRNVVRDCLIDAFRREYRACRNPLRERYWPEASSVQGRLGLVSTDSSPSNCASRNDLEARLKEALNQLDDEHRDLITMRHSDGMPFTEVAAALEISVPAARLRYVRALNRLRNICRHLIPEEMRT